MFPACRWLPKASAAPTPVTALLHAVAVVKAGAFAILRLTYYCYDVNLLRGSWAQWVCMGAASFTIFYGAARAVKETHWKRRLAWSTVANLSYILFGATLMTPAGMSGAMLHMAFHAEIANISRIWPDWAEKCRSRSAASRWPPWRWWASRRWPAS